MPRHPDHDHDDSRGPQRHNAHPDPSGTGPDPRQSSQVNRERYGRQPAELGQYGMRPEGAADYGRYGDDHGSGYERTGYDSAPGRGDTPAGSRGRASVGASGYGGYEGSDYGAPGDHASFDSEYRRREERNHRPRSIPTGLSHTPNGPGWVGSGDPARSERHIDPDYHQWRSEQMRQMDAEYDEWRKERYQKFSDDFGGWRNQRAAGRTGPSADASSAAPSGTGGDTPDKEPSSAASGTSDTSATKSSTARK